MTEKSTTGAHGGDSGTVHAILDSYFEGLQTSDASGIPLAEDVVLENPETRISGEPLQGPQEVNEFLETASENMPRIEVEGHVVDGDRVCTLFEWESSGGTVVPTVDYFEIDEGAISRIQIYLDLSAAELLH